MRIASDLSSFYDKVSVVIPVYNSERFLTESIESVLNQTYKNIEIFAIDDGSTDNSLEILQRYGNKIIILSQSNQGLAPSLNAATKKITGKWFKWFSPDDILYPEAIEILVAEAKKLSENTIVYSNWELIDHKNKKLRNFSESNYNSLGNFEFNVRLLDGQQINVNTTLIPTSLFDRGCLFQDLDDQTAIDYDFFLRAGVLFGTNFHLISDSLLKYRIHSTQLSHKNIPKTLSYLSYIRNKILSKLDNSERDKYLNSLEEYKKKKPLSKKTMELSIKFATWGLPNWMTNRLLVFYLNKIREHR